MARWKRDVLCGVGLLLACAFCYYETSDLPSGRVPFAARSDVYVWLWLVILAFLSVLLIVTALIKKDETKMPPMWSKLRVITLVALVVYLLVMDIMGFILSTFIFLMVTVYLYSRKMGIFEGKSQPEKTKNLAGYALFSLLMSVAVFLIFSKGLDVNLPTLGLF